MFFFHNRRLSSFQLILLGFAAVILTGCLLLMLPEAKSGTGHASFLDALFTATSSVCVTGLVVHDTATYWSAFGQLVIICLIQIGGMGVVTIAVLLTVVSGKKVSLMQRSTMQEAIAAHKVGGIVRLTGFILRVMVAVELIGALSLSLVFCRDFGLGRGLWYGLFHSISSFCNAGFDLMGVRQPFSSLTHYAGNTIVSVTVMLLIMIGGIGFLTWEDVRINGLRLRRYRMQSKVILTVTLLLISLPALFFFFHEFAGLPLRERLLLSLFQAVTPRTAGYNTADLTAISEPGQAIMIILMLIGGSPGSTAGGMKTTTVAVLIASALAVFQRGGDAHFFGRRVAVDAVRNAAAVLLVYLTLFLAGGLAISCLEELPLMTSLFETASAIGTVGLTLGITPQLGLASRIILILLMFFGRVGGLTIIFAAVAMPNKTMSKLPQEKITVG